MKTKQYCNSLQEVHWISQQFLLNGQHDLSQSFITHNQQDYIAEKLKDILASLQEQKNQFLAFHHRQKELLIEKINSQKDKIIEELLKSIHNLKKQNEQLKFQYRKRHKFIKSIEQKYDHIILSKNKKITEYQSILKYLEAKIKFLQKKLQKIEIRNRVQLSQSKHFLSPKYERTYLSPNKISLIISKEIQPQIKSKKKPVRNSFDEFTIPLTSSFVSESKVTSSSKTIARKRAVGRSQFDDIWRLKGDFIENDIYSSFLTSTDHNINEYKIDSQTNIQDVSGITPICLESSLSPKKYITLDDFDDLDNKQMKIYDRPLRKSQQMNMPQLIEKNYRYN